MLQKRNLHRTESNSRGRINTVAGIQLNSVVECYTIWTETNSISSLWSLLRHQHCDATKLCVKSYTVCCCVTVPAFENTTAPPHVCVFYLISSLLWNYSDDTCCRPTSWPGHLVKEILTSVGFSSGRLKVNERNWPGRGFRLLNDSSPPDGVKGSLLKVMFWRRKTSGLTQLQHLQALLTLLCHLLKPDETHSRADKLKQVAFIYEIFD